MSLRSVGYLGRPYCFFKRKRNHANNRCFKLPCFSVNMKQHEHSQVAVLLVIAVMFSIESGLDIDLRYCSLVSML
jgi:hypothetical protein